VAADATNYALAAAIDILRSSSSLLTLTPLPTKVRTKTLFTGFLVASFIYIIKIQIRYRDYVFIQSSNLAKN
jgi:hypothetical protein